MPELKLQQEVFISGDLFSRLQARSLLNSSGEPTRDFYAYLVECLARDDARCQVVLPVAKPSTDMQEHKLAPAVNEERQMPEEVTAISQPRLPPTPDKGVQDKLKRLYSQGGH